MPGDVKPGTSGRVVPGYEAKILDDAGNEAPDGEAGQLIIRGESVTTGYWNKPEENAEKVLPGGWFKTGDMYVREDGYFTYQGRGDDMLKVALNDSFIQRTFDIELIIRGRILWISAY